MQFSCSVNESSVQFIDPVQTRCPSITTYLWCISVPKPITGRTSRPSESMYSGGAAGRGTLSGTSRLVSRSSWSRMRTRTPRSRRPCSVVAMPAASRVLDVEVVDRDRDVLLRRREERDQLARDVGDRLAALVQEAKLDRAAHRGAPPRGDRADLVGRVDDLHEREVVARRSSPRAQQPVSASSRAGRSSTPSRRARPGSA